MRAMTIFGRCGDALGATCANGSIWMIKSACPPLNMVWPPLLRLLTMSAFEDTPLPPQYGRHKWKPPALVWRDNSCFSICSFLERRRKMLPPFFIASDMMLGGDTNRAGSILTSKNRESIVFSNFQINNQFLPMYSFLLSVRHQFFSKES